MIKLFFRKKKTRTLFCKCQNVATIPKNVIYKLLILFYKFVLILSKEKINSVTSQKFTCNIYKTNVTLSYLITKLN